MPFAKQAFPFVAVLLAGALLLGLMFGGPAAIPCLAAAAFVLFFFRDPERRSPGDEALVVAPADGRVTAVERPPAGGARVSIFLSLFNCHINRSPVSGTITEATHTPGRFRPAWAPDVDRVNERNHLVIRSGDGDYGVTQIAGVLARRIVCSKRVGDRVLRGERIGLIQFGSRTDLHLPPGVEPTVRPGDRVRGAVTVLARRAESVAARAAGGSAT